MIVYNIIDAEYVSHKFKDTVVQKYGNVYGMDLNVANEPNTM